MRAAFLVLAVMAVALVLNLNRLQEPEDQVGALTAVSNAIEALPPIVDRTPRRAERSAAWTDLPQVTRQRQTFQAPEPGMYASSWFGAGANKNRARVIATDPVKGLLIFTITRTAAMRGTGAFPTFDQVKRLYNAEDGQDVGTLAKASFKFRDGFMHVSNFELKERPRFFNPNYAVVDPDDPTNEAHAWEGITRFRLERGGSLVAVNFDQMFAGTIAKRYVRLEKP